MLPPELQHAIRDALARLDTNGMDAEDILRIGALFGSLNDIQQRFTRLHQRRLLMQLLTLRHLVPLWEHYLPDDRRFHNVLDSMLALTMKRHSYDHETLDLLWQQVALYPHEQPVIEHIGISLYTLLKVFDMIENLAVFYDYTPDIHAGVALWGTAHAYAAHQTSARQMHYDHIQRYWRYWLTGILPRAWFALAA